jgi:hypothetical protein
MDHSQAADVRHLHLDRAASEILGGQADDPERKSICLTPPFLVR